MNPYPFNHCHKGTILVHLLAFWSEFSAGCAGKGRYLLCPLICRRQPVLVLPWQQRVFARSVVNVQGAPRMKSSRFSMSMKGADFRRLYPANAKTPMCCPSDDNRTKVTNSVTSARSLWWHVGPYFWPADLTRTANPIDNEAILGSRTAVSTKQRALCIRSLVLEPATLC